MVLITDDMNDALQAYINRTQEKVNKSRTMEKVENQHIISNEKKIKRMCPKCKKEKHEGNCQ